MSSRSSGILTSNSSRRSSQSPKSQRKKSEKEIQISYFKEVITEVGVTLGNDDVPNIITQEQSLVTRDISKILRAHITYPNNAEEFITGLKLLCRRETYFRKALLPTQLKKGIDFEFKIQQESLVRILLNVSCLQNGIIEILLEQMTDTAAKDDDDTTWLRLLLNPLRYLSHIDDPKTLTTKLLDILEIATFTAQLEILNLIPEIIPDKEYEETAKQLSKLLEEHTDLTGAIIDCLNSLNLSSEVRNEIQQQILSELESTSSSKIFPILFEFLVTDCNTKTLPTILMNARSAIDMIMGQNENDKEADSNKVLIINRLRFFATAQKSVYEGWINVITSIHSNADEKPVDLLLLFILHSVGNTRKHTIEGLFKKRIKAGLFKISLLESLFNKYFVSQILKDHLKSILEIAASLLRFSNDLVLTEFASAMYKMLFSHELTERVQRQDIIYDLILLSGMSDKRSITPVLNVLVSLLDDFDKLQQHSLQLMGLLEKLDAINLKDVKLVFHLLCSLTCGEKADDSMSGLRDEIHMIVRKQLSSSKQIVKHRGIIAAVVMAKVLATACEEQGEVSVDDSLSMADLPRGGPQEAAALLELANTSTLGSPDSVGLYYDQLASVLATTSNLNNYFMIWLYRLITNDFQEVFVTESTPDPINDIHISMQFSLNTDEEVDNPFAINIAELTMKSQYYQNCSILTLAPLFRLLRLIYYKQHDGDLGEINAVLGCGIVMPDLDDINTYDTEQLKQVSDSIFHCINWFRELISAFVTQKSRKLRNKVLERLAGVVQLEELLQKYLENIPDHKLPSSYFEVLSQSSKQLSPVKPSKIANPRKKQKISDTIVNPNETTASTSAGTQQTKTTGATKKKKDLNIEKDYGFREMDTDIILLLRYPLKIGDDLNISTISQTPAPSQLTSLDIHQFKFLMKDFVLKLNMLSNKKDLGLSHVSTVNLSDLVTDSIRLLPSIKRHLRTITANLDKLLEQTDGCLDSEHMFTPEANNLKITFTLVMQCYALIFGWPGFQHTKNLNLLRECLKAMQGQQQSQVASIRGLVNELTIKLLENVNHCLYLPAAVNLIEIMQALYSINTHPDLKKRIAVVSGKLLNKRWYNLNGDLETGRNSNINIDKLVKAYLSSANVKTICGLVGTLQDQIGDLKLKDDCLGMLGSISKANFHVFYRCLCVALLETVRSEITSLTNNQHLVLWRTTALTMQGLMAVVKAQETKPNLLNFLKNSIGILKVFLSSGIPILEIMLRTKTNEVVEIFKIMQTSTRFLHHLCCFSKFNKDTSLVAYVPQFRHVLESLLYRVKAALVANGCSEAFWMGTLRNRNLQGEDILSQSSMETEQTEDTPQDSEELPPDESDEEMAVAEESKDGSDGESSASEIF